MPRIYPYSPRLAHLAAALFVVVLPAGCAEGTHSALVFGQLGTLLAFALVPTILGSVIVGVQVQRAFEDWRRRR